MTFVFLGRGCGWASAACAALTSALFLLSVSLSLSAVYGHNVKSSNDFIGRIVIGQYSTGAPESNHWRRMLSAHRTAVEQWHSLRSRQDCDRVSPASLEAT